MGSEASGEAKSVQSSYSVDPLAEMDYSGSPYAFGFNNPAYFSDPSGLRGIDPPVKSGGCIGCGYQGGRGQTSSLSGSLSPMGISSYNNSISPYTFSVAYDAVIASGTGSSYLSSDEFWGSIQSYDQIFGTYTGGGGGGSGGGSGGGVSLSFNGRTLSLTDNGRKVFSAAAVSGRPLDDGAFDYSLTRQRMKSVGPIPEGQYSISPGSIQWWTNQSFTQRTLAFLGFIKIKAGAWPGGFIAWGVARTDITPDGANVYGRSGFTIHGGTSPGSAGCIDLMGNDLKFFRALENYQHLNSIPLQVTY